MSFNLVGLVQDQIDDQLLRTMGGILGTENSQTNAALSGALPGLLSGIMNASSQPAGAGALLEAARRQDDDVLGNIGNLLSGDPSHTLVTQGNSTLSVLLGSDAPGQLADVIASFSGLSRDDSLSLLGMLTPIMIGVIKRKIVETGMTAHALSGMLREQRRNICAAMPHGFADQLHSAGFFDSISAVPAVVVAPAPATPAPLPSDADDTIFGSGFMKWLIPVAALLVLVFLGMRYVVDDGDAASESSGNARDTVSTETAQATAEGQTPVQNTVVDSLPNIHALSAEALQAAQASMPADIDLPSLTDSLAGVFGSTSEALASISDVESARTAVAAIEAASDTLGELKDVISPLPAAADAPIEAVVSNGVASVKPLIDKVTAIPGVAEVIHPVLGPMLATVQDLTD